MNTTGQKIVIDTNVFITIIGRKSSNRWIFDKIVKGDFQLCISSEILLEYEEILTKKANKIVARNIIDFLLISPFVHLTHVFYSWNLVRQDYEDNKFLDCLIASNAFCLLTNDKHFNEAKNLDFPQINILSLDEFSEKFKNL